ncbi:hypothetical protein S7335_4483 [Synechococcus sp. PCC 7335]|uniref:hypothetical protein n=1 Tax=Synechococcus sp. (strain ATCC 29403 / PCC 7335) TaxID=91464 RepID=UPI00017EB4B9|nr:hypothetical protein [Synechococcus sp. PCC 7335]EDX86777.1 hypothetical protein S7335_4483 [Synechococcus sp. PCC 7335]
MEKQLYNLHPLKAPIENEVRRLFKIALGYELCQVECRVLESFDIVINVERRYSATESFLLQQCQPELAYDIGLTINQTLKGKLALSLIREFDLGVVEISLLEPATPRNFGLFVLIDRQPAKLSYLAGSK